MSRVKANDYEKEVDYYFNSLKKYRKLSNEEEKELGFKIQNGDKEALNTLVEHNLRFVVNIAKGYRERGVPFADLISEGNLGLIHAANKFDPNKNIRFISYAVWWIRCYINDFIEEQMTNSEVSTDEYENYQYHKDFINENFEENLNNLNDRNSTIADLLICLKDRERRIIQMSFGLNGEKEMTLDEIKQAESEVLKQRKKALDAFKAGTMKSHAVNAIRRSCDTMLEELERKKKKVMK